VTPADDPLLIGRLAKIDAASGAYTSPYHRRCDNQTWNVSSFRPDKGLQAMWLDGANNGP
jgi:hypothetical protein